MNQLNDSNGDRFDSEDVHYRALNEVMTYDCNRQQHQNGYNMQGLNMVDSGSNYALGQQSHTLDLYSGDYHNFQTDQLDSSASYYGASSNSDLMMPAYDTSHDGPSSSGMNVGQYFTSVDPMMMVQPPSQQTQPYATGGLDYTDVNNLEPSLMPGQVEAIHANSAANQQTLHQQMQRPPNGVVSMQPPPPQQQPQHLQQPSMAAYVAANYYNGSYHSSPTGSSHTSSGTDISDEGDDMYGLSPYKRSPTSELDYRNVKGKRQGKKRKPRKDPNEPQKPVSAYALFFRDTQAAIKGQNPNASFGEVSKIVASMWDSLGSEAKNVYKQKTESAKKEYLKQLAAYRANLLSKGNRGCITMDPFAELAAQQRKAAMQTQATSSPDSTTPSGIDQRDPCSEIGTKTLASLIAEPAPQQVLTATTTLTVPQSYTAARSKVEYSLEGDGSGGGNPLCIRTAGGCHPNEQPHWEREYCAEECVAKSCRDMYNGWVPARQQQQPTGAYAPV